VWIAFEAVPSDRSIAMGEYGMYGAAEGLHHTTVYAIEHDRDGDLWIGGSGGLSLLSGQSFSDAHGAVRVCRGVGRGR